MKRLLDGVKQRITSPSRPVQRLIPAYSIIALLTPPDPQYLVIVNAHAADSINDMADFINRVLLRNLPSDTP